MLICICGCGLHLVSVRHAAGIATLTYPIRNLVNKELSHPNWPLGQVGCDSLDGELVEYECFAVAATCWKGTGESKTRY